MYVKNVLDHTLKLTGKFFLLPLKQLMIGKITENDIILHWPSLAADFLGNRPYYHNDCHPIVAFDII